MPIPVQSTITGDFVLPDRTGTIVSYNGIIFGPLLKSTCEGTPAPDQANRTMKYVDTVVAIEGYVTLRSPSDSTDTQWTAIRQALSKEGGRLTYTGKGFGKLDVNGAGGQKDVKWGPIPKLLYFQPLGGSRSAIIKWQCSACVAELAAQPTIKPGSSQPCQWNYGATLDYDEDGYSKISLKGTLEIPMTRGAIGDRSIPDLVDAYRANWMNVQLDPLFFRQTGRSFDYSRDKRTCEWSVEGEELPPMPLPVGCNRARGNMTVREINIGGGDGTILATCALSQWAVTLRATYTLRSDYPRRMAYLDFMSLLAVRMNCSANAIKPDAPPAVAPPAPLFSPAALAALAGQGGVVGATAAAALSALALATAAMDAATPPAASMNGILFGFSFDEGLYLDSKTQSFEATWYLVTKMEGLLAASGWTQVGAGQQSADWKKSAGVFFGYKSWLTNNIDPAADVIVDLGGGGPPTTNLPFPQTKAR